MTTPAQLPPPPPGSFCSGVILDRRHPDIGAQVERIAGLPGVPDEAVAALAAWHDCPDGHRYLLATDLPDGYEVLYVDDDTELRLEVLLVLARAEASQWQLYTAPDTQGWLMALLLQCAKPGGTA